MVTHACMHNSVTVNWRNEMLLYIPSHTCQLSISKYGQTKLPVRQQHISVSANCTIGSSKTRAYVGILQHKLTIKKCVVPVMSVARELYTASITGPQPFKYLCSIPANFIKISQLIAWLLVGIWETMLPARSYAESLATYWEKIFKDGASSGSKHFCGCKIFHDTCFAVKEFDQGVLANQM